MDRMTRMPSLFPKKVASLLLIAIAAVPVSGQDRHSLDEVLERMAAVGMEFETLEARIERDTVNILVNDHDLNAGTVYFAARGRESSVRMNLTEPEIARQEVLVAEGRWQSYNPRTHQVSQGELGGRADVAQYLVVGFGPANASLEENFVIQLIGEEDVGGVATSVLDLVPRAEEVLRNVSRVRLWVDQRRWIPVQQKLDQPGGNYQVVTYSDIEINEGLPGGIFELDLPDGVEVLRF